MGHFEMDCIEICCDGIRVAEYHLHASFSGAELSDSAAIELMFSVLEGGKSSKFTRYFKY